jgi:hypothetical protein
LAQVCWGVFWNLFFLLSFSPSLNRVNWTKSSIIRKVKKLQIPSIVLSFMQGIETVNIDKPFLTA